MLTRLLKLAAYTRAPRATFAVLHPIRTAQLAKVPFDLKTAYAPRITAVAVAILVAPLAYRLGRRAGEGTLLTPRRSAGMLPSRPPTGGEP